MKAIKTLILSVAMAVSGTAMAFDPAKVLTMDYVSANPNKQYTEEQMTQMLKYIQKQTLNAFNITRSVSHSAHHFTKAMKDFGYLNLRMIEPGSTLGHQLNNIILPELKKAKVESRKAWNAVLSYNSIRWESKECKNTRTCEVLLYDIYNATDDNRVDYLEGSVFQKYSDLYVTTPFNLQLQELTSEETIGLMLRAGKL